MLLQVLKVLEHHAPILVGPGGSFGGIGVAGKSRGGGARRLARCVRGLPRETEGGCLQEEQYSMACAITAAAFLLTAPAVVGPPRRGVESRAGARRTAVVLLSARPRPVSGT